MREGIREREKGDERQRQRVILQVMDEEGERERQSVRVFQ
jgi:hypothetical protein